MKHHMDQDASEIGANRAAAPPPSATGSDVRTGMQADSLRQAVLDHLYYSLGCPPIRGTSSRLLPRARACHP